MKKTIILLIILVLFSSCDLFKAYQVLSEIVPEPVLPKDYTNDVMMPINEQFAPNIDNTWTFMIVLNGDNNLESYAIEDFNEMELGLYKALLRNPNLVNHLNIIVLFDRGTYAWSGGVPGWDDTRIFKISPDADMGATNSEDITFNYRNNTGAQEEQNLGAPEAFTDFINYCTSTYLTDHYALIVWNHGNGPIISKSMASFSLSISKPNYSISGDDNDGSYNYDECTIKELQSALATTNLLSEKKLDLMGFDACLMASVEVAYQFRDQVDYLVASMDEEGPDGWNYETLFENMGITQGGYHDSRTLSKVMVQNYYDSYKNSKDSGEYATMSAIDLSKIEALKPKIDNLAYSLAASSDRNAIIPIRQDSYSYKDLGIYGIGLYVDCYDFCANIEINYGKESFLGQAARDVIEEFSHSIVAAYGHEDYGHYIGPGEFVKRGLYIVYSNELRGLENLSFIDWYNDSKLDFCKTTSNGITDTWTELLQDWF
ncbi:MAG: hypothetical protein JXR70_18210 [Spirochaetales bacterium]|nr:hypothetical protein [Spirochaetales bacterium]